MVEWFTVIALVLFGLILVIVEIIFVPGITLVGLGGAILIAVGIGLSFKYFGSELGWTTIGVTGAASGLLFFISFKANVWGRFALKSTNSGKVNEGHLDELKPGEEGVAVSELRPVGKADLGGKSFEVRTMGEYVESGKKIRIIRIASNQIIVEPLN